METDHSLFKAGTAGRIRKSVDTSETDMIRCFRPKDVSPQKRWVIRWEFGFLFFPCKSGGKKICRRILTK